MEALALCLQVRKGHANASQPAKQFAEMHTRSSRRLLMMLRKGEGDACETLMLRLMEAVPASTNLCLGGKRGMWVNTNSVS